MATAPVLADLTRRIRRDEWETMGRAGLFEGERVELLYGVIVETSPKGVPRDPATERALREHASWTATVRIQSSFAASDDSQPEPDVAVVPTGGYRDAHPREAYLLVEVADSSLAVDREVKARLYAESNVPEYWIVNVRDGVVEVHTEIVRGVYTKVLPHRAGDRITLVKLPDVSFAAADIL